MAARRGKKREADPPTQLRQLEAGLERDGFARGYVLRGEERYFRERALDTLKARAVSEGLELRMHDGQDPDFSLPRLLDDLGGAGLFATRQLVVARNMEKHLKKSDKDASPLTRAIAGFVGGEDAGAVVVSLASLRADHAAAKAVAKAGGVVFTSRKLYDSPPPWEDPDPRRAEVVLWLAARARDMGLKLSDEQAVYICAATGNDLNALEAQLDLLRDAPSGTEFKTVIGWDARTSPWAVAEVVAAGDLPRALEGVETLFRGGFEDRDGRLLLDLGGLTAMLIGSLSSELRRGLAVTTEIEAGSTPEEAAGLAGLKGPPSALQGQIARAQQRDREAWREMTEDLARLERKTRSTAGVRADDFVLLALRWRQNARKRVSASR